MNATRSEEHTLKDFIFNVSMNIAVVLVLGLLLMKTVSKGTKYVLLSLVGVCACACLCVVTLLLNHLFSHLSNQFSVILFSGREGD